MKPSKTVPTPAATATVSATSVLVWPMPVNWWERARAGFRFRVNTARGLVADPIGLVAARTYLPETGCLQSPERGGPCRHPDRLWLCNPCAIGYPAVRVVSRVRAQPSPREQSNLRYRSPP